MSNSLQSHRLYSPWNSPGQNTGLSSLSLLQGIFPTQELNPGWARLTSQRPLPGCESESRSVVSNFLQPNGLYSPWDSPGQNTGVGNLSLFQGISPTQGSNPGLLHCRRILYQLSHKGNPCQTVSNIN